MTFDAILAALLVENRRCDPPLPEGEVERVAQSISKYDPQATPLLDLGADDEGNALAVKALFGDRFLYCPAYGWLRFNGRYWQHEGAVVQLERATIEALKMRQTQAVQANRPDIVAAARPSTTHMQAALTLLRSHVQADVQEFDASPDHVNVSNGVIDLRTGTLEPHHAGQRFTYCLSVAYDASADRSLWLDFLRQVVTEDAPEVITFLQEAVGYALTGHTKEEKLLYLHGPTRSGKGTFTETLLGLFGHPLSSEVDFNTFTRDRSNDANNFDLAPLKPVRLLVASESSHYERLNEAKIKQLTGGNYIRCAFKYGTHFTYRPQSKIVLVSNHEIKADPLDDALWGRVVRVEFPYSYLGREDTTLKERLKSPEHLQGVLAWVVEGAIRWYQKGLRVPPVLQGRLKEVRLEQDHIQQWLEACTEPDVTSFVSNSMLYQSYELWCLGEGYKPSSMVHLGRALKQKGLKPTKRGQRGYEGLRMRNGA
jgi:putative DNA primase/helicase